MRIQLWGIDYRRSFHSLQKKIWIPAEKKSAFFEKVQKSGFRDLVYLSTCNRIEFYSTASDPFVDFKPQWLKLFELLGMSESDYYTGYALEGKSAIRHLLKVASSLESMTIGEPQILGQVKDAVAFSKSIGIELSADLERVFQLAFETAKKIRNETDIAKKSVSIVSLVLKKIEKYEREVPLKKLVVVGRGEMSRQVIDWVIKSKPKLTVLWVNRSLEKIKSLVPPGAPVECFSLSQFKELNYPFSHLITATSAGTPIFDSDTFSHLRQPAVIFDLAEPYDVTEGPISNMLKIFHISDLEEEAHENRKQRFESCQRAEQIISEQMKQFFFSLKEAPILGQFQFMEKYLVEELISKDSAGGEKPRDWDAWVKKTVHITREHLKQLLRESAHIHEHSLNG